ncbi:MAG: hypothetical protein V3T86_08830 [Planctomycetota bacterium]
MTRLLLILLVGSNAAWVVVRTTQAPPAPPRVASTDPREAELQRRIDTLRAEAAKSDEKTPKPKTPRRVPARNDWKRSQAAWKQSSAWRQRLSGRDKEDARAVRAEVRAGLVSDDLLTLEAALRTVHVVAWAEKRAEPKVESLRLLVLPHLDSKVPEIRHAAFAALRSAGAEPEDLPRLLALEKSGENWSRATLPHLLRQAASDPVQAEVRAVVLRLLDDQSRSVIDHTLAAWGRTDLGPEFVEKVVVLAGRPETRRSAIERMLGRLDPKPDSVVELLMKVALTDGQSMDVALASLRHGVSEHQRPRVADYCVRVLQTRTNARMHVKCLDLLAMYGRRADVPALLAWADETAPSKYVRRSYDKALAAIRKRS